MPDPEGAKRLIARDCLVKFDKDTLESPRRVMDFADVEVGVRPDGSQRFTPKTDSIMSKQRVLYRNRYFYTFIWLNYSITRRVIEKLSRHK